MPRWQEIFSLRLQYRYLKKSLIIYTINIFTITWDLLGDEMGNNLLKVNHILFCIFLFEYSNYLRFFLLAVYIWWIYIVAPLNIDFRNIIANFARNITNIWIQMWSVYNIIWFLGRSHDIRRIVFPFLENR